MKGPVLGAEVSHGDEELNYGNQISDEIHCLPIEENSIMLKTEPLQTAILEALSRLPESLQREVLHFVEFLLTRYGKSAAIETGPITRGGFGAWKGHIKIADDFDAPLDDFNDYM